MENLIVNILVAIVVSAISNKILAAYTFRVIDGYVKDIVEIAKQSIRNAHFSK